MSMSIDTHAAADHFHLDRFLAAQTGVYQNVVQELRSGQKRSHWMWFIFPQMAGLGTSPTARLYAITGLEEARAYLAHPVLGARLTECTNLVNAHEGRTAHQIFGSPDDMKFHSSMTLFELASGAASDFAFAIEKYFAGARDPLTLQLLGRSPGS